MNNDKEVWVVEGDTAIHNLDDKHKLFVIREVEGISLKVKDYTEERPRIIYSRFIGDLQLGHIFRRKK